MNFRSVRFQVTTWRHVSNTAIAKVSVVIGIENFVLEIKGSMEHENHEWLKRAAAPDKNAKISLLSRLRRLWVDLVYYLKVLRHLYN